MHVFPFFWTVSPDFAEKETPFRLRQARYHDQNQRCMLLPHPLKSSAVRQYAHYLP